MYALLIALWTIKKIEAIHENLIEIFFPFQTGKAIKMKKNKRYEERFMQGNFHAQYREMKRKKISFLCMQGEQESKWSPRQKWNFYFSSRKHNHQRKINLLINCFFFFFSFSHKKKRKYQAFVTDGKLKFTQQKV